MMTTPPLAAAGVAAVFNLPANGVRTMIATAPNLKECRERLTGVERQLAAEQTPSDRALLKRERRFLRDEIARQTESEWKLRARAAHLAAQENAAVLKVRVDALAGMMSRARAEKDPRKKAELSNEYERERASLNVLVNELPDDLLLLATGQNRGPKTIPRPRPRLSAIARPLSDSERIAQLADRLSQAEAKIASLAKQKPAGDA